MVEGSVLALTSAPAGANRYGMVVMDAQEELQHDAGQSRGKGSSDVGVTPSSTACGQADAAKDRGRAAVAVKQEVAHSLKPEPHQGNEAAEEARERAARARGGRDKVSAAAVEQEGEQGGGSGSGDEGAAYDAAARSAMAAQPTGFTLSTTTVRGKCGAGGT
jgi:hypothetical protein